MSCDVNYHEFLKFWSTKQLNQPKANEYCWFLFKKLDIYRLNITIEPWIVYNIFSTKSLIFIWLVHKDSVISLATVALGTKASIVFYLNRTLQEMPKMIWNTYLKIINFCNFYPTIFVDKIQDWKQGQDEPSYPTFN